MIRKCCQVTVVTACYYCVWVAALGAPGNAQVVHVNQHVNLAGDGSSWSAACKTLDQGLSIAKQGDQVWIAGATYRPGDGVLGPSASYLVDKGITLIGGFEGTESSADEADPLAYPTVLSGDLGVQGLFSDNAYKVVRIDAPGQTVVLKGLIVTGGRGQGPPGQPGPVSGGGAGIVLVGGQLRMEECLVERNEVVFIGSGAGLWIAEGLTARAEKCTFRHNTAKGSGGAVHLEGGARFYGTGCVFQGNSSDNGGGAIHGWHESPTLELRDCLLIGNSTTGIHGGGAVAWWSSVNSPTFDVLIARCTFAGNRVDVDDAFAQSATGAALKMAGGTASVIDTIAWGNVTNALVNPHRQQVDVGGLQLGVPNSGSAMVLTRSCVQGPIFWFTGSGNINSDPLFADILGPDGEEYTGDEDLRPDFGSPCIDSGGAGALGQGLDLTGTPRWLDGDLDGVQMVDRGALEYSHAQLSMEAGPATVAVSIHGTQGLWGMLLVGTPGGVTQVPPYGLVLLDAVDPFVVAGVGYLPVSFAAATPVPSLGLSVTVQALGLDVGSGAGSLSNAVVLDL